MESLNSCGLFKGKLNSRSPTVYGRTGLPTVDVEVDGGSAGSRSYRGVPVAAGITLCFLGLLGFNIGLKYGLTRLGEQSGCLIPAIFTRIEAVPSSPLISAAGEGGGIQIADLALGNGTGGEAARALVSPASPAALAVVLIIAWLLGFGATLAEPALRVLGRTTEELTEGSFKQSLVVYSVAFGVALGVSLGVLKVSGCPASLPTFNPHSTLIQPSFNPHSTLAAPPRCPRAGAADV